MLLVKLLSKLEKQQWSIIGEEAKKMISLMMMNESLYCLEFIEEVLNLDLDCLLMNDEGFIAFIIFQIGLLLREHIKLCEVKELMIKMLQKRILAFHLVHSNLTTEL